MLPQIWQLQDSIEIGRPPAILTPALIFRQEPSLTEIVQCPANCRTGDVQLSCDCPNGRPADAILIGAVFEIHIHRSRPVGQVREINRIEISHSITSRTKGRRIIFRPVQRRSWPGKTLCSRRRLWRVRLRILLRIFLQNRLLQLFPVRIVDLPPAMVRRLVRFSEGDPPVQE